MTTTKTKITTIHRIRSRDDLSFTRRDEKGQLRNWSVPHDPVGNWHVGIEVGRRHFAEVAELAAHDEQGAFNALRFALDGFHSGGWGIECGFALEMARTAVTGLRALRDGTQEVYSNAELEKLLAVGQKRG